MTPALLEVEGLDRRFGGLHAVRELSFRVEAGRIQALIGPNGAGKSTVFNMIAGALRPDGGRIAYRGRAITGRKPHAVAALGIARTFQTTRLFPHMTALENVQVGRHVRSKAGFLAGLFHLPWTWREERSICEEAAKTLEKLGLSALAEREAGTLSFGQQRMVEFARALAMEPELLLLDEPAAGLNIHETAELAGLLTRIREWGITILIVEHDMSLVMGISDHIVVLNQGAKMTEGKPAEIQKDPEVVRIYLGDDHA
jgi:branched-chain amino acid transport system ATP-binding protein